MNLRLKPVSAMLSVSESQRRHGYACIDPARSSFIAAGLAALRDSNGFTGSGIDVPPSSRTAVNRHRKRPINPRRGTSLFLKLYFVVFFHFGKVEEAVNTTLTCFYFFITVIKM